METRVLKVHSVKAGGNAGKNARSYRLPLPSAWVKEMGITPDEREVIMHFDSEAKQIIVEKNTEE